MVASASVVRSMPRGVGPMVGVVVMGAVYGWRLMTP